MPPKPIYLSTSKFAKLAGTTTAAIYAGHSRYGHYLCVTPRKGERGQLSWPAAEVRAVCTPNLEDRPNGSEEFVKLMADIAPEADELHLWPIALALLGSERLPGWKPSPGQFDERRLELEAAMLGMLVQAWAERLDQAETLAGRELAVKHWEWLRRVVGASLGLKGVNHG